MQLTSVSTTTGSSASRSTASASDVDKLQKQLRELTDALKQASSDQSLDAKARQQKVKLLQSQIQVVQAQIEALQRQKQQDQLDQRRGSDSGQEAQKALKVQEPQQRRVPPTAVPSNDIPPTGDAVASAAASGPTANAPRRRGGVAGLGDNVDTYA